VISWVVGRGLLGRTVERALASRGEIWTTEDKLRWDDAGVLRRQLADAVRSFATAAGEQTWQVAWCAGAGVVASTGPGLHDEEAALATLLEQLAVAMGARAPGAVFVASSAGGVYAGSVDPPFTESSEPRPLSPYGETRLRQEAQARAWASATGVPVVIGRIANLFGPGQDITKPQGLISQLAAAMLRRRPISLYVPLDTIRDYLFVPDCADLVVAALERARTAQAGGPVVTKILASGQGITVASVLAELRRVLHRRPQVSLATSPLSQLQALDLRFRSEVWPDLDRRPLTPFPVAVHALVRDVEQQLRAGHLVPTSVR
jgi:UDP-glucose 4-epimerase